MLPSVNVAPRLWLIAVVIPTPCSSGPVAVRLTNTVMNLYLTCGAVGEHIMSTHVNRREQLAARVNHETSLRAAA